MCNSCRSRRVCVSVTQRQETTPELSCDWITKLLRDLRDTHTHLTELERTSVCKVGVGVSHVFGTWYFADSNTRGGSLCLQPRKSHVQMTEALQTPSACHSNGTSAVGTQMDVHVLSTSQELVCTSLHSWLRWPRCIPLHMMIERSPTVFEHPH